MFERIDIDEILSGHVVILRLKLRNQRLSWQLHTLRDVLLFSVSTLISELAIVLYVIYLPLLRDVTCLKFTVLDHSVLLQEI